MDLLVIGEYVTRDEAIVLAKDNPNQMVVKKEEPKIGGYYCALCGAWIGIDSHSFDCMYLDID